MATSYLKSQTTRRSQETCCCGSTPRWARVAMTTASGALGAGSPGRETRPEMIVRTLCGDCAPNKKSPHAYGYMFGCSG